MLLLAFRGKELRTARTHTGDDQAEETTKEDRAGHTIPGGLQHRRYGGSLQLGEHLLEHRLHLRRGRRLAQELLQRSGILLQIGTVAHHAMQVDGLRQTENHTGKGRENQHITITAEEGEALLGGKLGLSEDEISSFLNYVNDENSFTMLLCEDHIQGIGMLLKTVPTNQGIYALKHITPKDLSKEKMVLLKGSLQNIVDSVYVF